MSGEAILVIDDDKAMCELIEAGLQQAGYQVETHTRGEDGLAALGERSFSVLVTDLNLERMSGLDICKRAAESAPDVPVIVVTAFGDMDSVIAAIRSGAYDFINKPLEMQALVHAVRRAAQHRSLRQEVKRLREQVDSASQVGELVGQSAAMQRVYDMIRRISDADAAVVVSGESGTGKELVARALHAESDRSERPFVALNCAAVPANLLESELFGHVRGAFTDAKAARRGLFERADGGTVLLDEIGELPLEMQPKLLRVLQERKVQPVGASEEVPFDARVIAATNRDLETEVEAGRFREDLFYRLNVVQIHLPPLRARGNDILLLAQRFVEDAAERLGRPVNGITSEAAKKLLEYDWPGNVRQLQNCMERAVTLTRYESITVDDLPERVRRYESTRLDVEVDAEHMLSLEELERRYIERVLKATDGNKTQAAKVLGLDRRTLYRKLDRYAEEE